MDFKEYNYVTQDWFNQFPLGPDNPGERHWIDDAEQALGGDPKEVLYYFNEWRYRGRITPGIGVNASFGCSHAMGYGVQTPYAEIIEFANIGWSGSSNDAIARLAYTYCNAFDPPAIVVLWTYPQRREHIMPDGSMEKFRNQSVPNSWQENYIELQNNNLDRYNYQKNCLFLENFCLLKGIKLIQFDFADNDQKARDLIHPGPDWHLNMAAKIYDQL